MIGLMTKIKGIYFIKYLQSYFSIHFTGNIKFVIIYLCLSYTSDLSFPAGPITTDVAISISQYLVDQNYITETSDSITGIESPVSHGGTRYETVLFILQSK